MKTAQKTRTFEDKPAVRSTVPLLVGLVGPSGTGKTFSALRVSTGIQRVTGGEIYVIDTESRRALHYAMPDGQREPGPGQFRFRHLEFTAPFGPLDYLAAIEHCVKKGGKVIVIDSASHEHEGPGGLLEMHAAEVERRGGGDRFNMVAWGVVKPQRTRLVNTLLQLNANFVFCFRAKEKLKIVKGKEPIELGWQPIGGPELFFEMTLNMLLLPGANGHPSWQSEYDGERSVMKLPTQFRSIFSRDVQLDESIGEQLAEWAAGGAAPVASTQPEGADLLARYNACEDRATLDALEGKRRALWATLPRDQKAALKSASDSAKAYLAQREAEQPAASDAVDPSHEGDSPY